MSGIKNIFVDTLKEGGAWSLKRVSAFGAFWLAQSYIILVHIMGWTPFEYVYEWLMGWAAYIITGTVIDKKIMNKATIFGGSGSSTVTEETKKKTTQIVEQKPNDEIG